MRREGDYFGERALDLIYIAKRLKDALKLEANLTESGVDYMVETGNYVGGVVFRSERVGAFFYVPAESREAAMEVLRSGGWKPWEAS